MRQPDKSDDTHTGRLLFVTQVHEKVLGDVTLHRQPLSSVSGVQMAPDALGIALLPITRQPDEAISNFEIQAVQQSTLDLLAIVRPCFFQPDFA